MKRINLGDTHDRGDCTSTGYTVEIGQQRDGQYMLVITTNSRWQGSRDNEIFQIRGYTDLPAARADGEAITAHGDNPSEETYDRLAYLRDVQQALDEYGEAEYNGQDVARVSHGWVVE